MVVALRSWRAAVVCALPLALVWLAPSSAAAATFAAGEITADTTWRADQSPFEVGSDVVVRNGATLTIEPGVTVHMRSDTNLIVEQGALRALGSAAAPVVITSLRDQGGDTPAPGDWGQLRMLDGTLDAATLLQHTQIRYGKGVVVEAAAPTLDNVTIAGHAGPAIAIDLRASPRGSGNRAVGNTLDGIRVPAGDILGSVRWSLQGIPYVLAGTVGVGARPVVTSIEPNSLEQGASVEAVVRGTRLGGAESLALDGAGLSAVVRAGGTDTQFPVTITAVPGAPLGLRNAQVQVLAGQAALGNALAVIFPLPPIQVTGIQPGSIRAGETRAFAVSGSQLLGATLSISNSALTLSGYQTTDNQATFSLAAAANAAQGNAVLTFANPGAAKGTATATVLVRPPLPRIVVTPSVLALPAEPGARSFRIALSNADDEDHSFTLAVGNSAVAGISPLGFTIPAGQTQATVSVTGLANGQTTLTVSASGLAGVTVPVLVTPEYNSINSANAAAVGVARSADPSPQVRTAGPLASATVGVLAGGRYLGAVAPASLPLGAGPLTLVISGSGFEGVTGVSVLPAAGITLGTHSVSPDGASVSVPITVAADAAPTLRQIVLAGAHAPYAAIRPDADRLLITRPAPVVESIEPVLLAQGTTTALLRVRGSSLQGAQVLALPGDGLTIGQEPSVSADGTALTTQISVASNATPGLRVIQVATPGGASSASPAAANTVRVLAQGAPVAAVTNLTTPPVGVSRDASVAPAARPAQAVSSAVSVNVGAAVVSRAPAAAIIGEIVVLRVSGAELQGVTRVDLVPPDGVTVGVPIASTDGRSAEVTLAIRTDAPQSLRALVVRAGDKVLPFVDPTQASFRITPPLPRIDSVTPNTLQIGAGSRALVLRGANFQNASDVLFVPDSGVTVSRPPSVSADGTQATVNVTLAAGTAPGPRTVVVRTPAGETSPVSDAANTVLLATTLSASFDSLAAPAVGVARDSTTPPPPATADRVPSAQVGVVVGAVALSIEAPALQPLATGVLRITGVGLSAVTSVRLVGGDGVSLDPAFQVSPDGRELTVTIRVDGNPVGGQRQLELIGADGKPILFGNPAAGAVSIRAGTQYFLPGPNVGVAREPAPPTATRAALLPSALVGVMVGPLAISLDAPSLYPGASGSLRITGRGLDVVTGIGFTGASGVTAGTPQVNSEGTELTAPIAVAAGAAAGVRGVVLITATGTVPFADARFAQIGVASGVPSIESIEPIVWQQGSTFQLKIRGQHLGFARAVLANPAAGITFDPGISVTSDGTLLTINVSVAADAPPTGEGAVQVVTPGGTTTATRSPANGFRLVR